MKKINRVERHLIKKIKPNVESDRLLLLSSKKCLQSQVKIGSHFLMELKT